MIRGEIIKIQSQTESDWGRYTLDCAGKETLAVGVIPGASLGLIVTVEGAMETNKYGTQYKITSVLNVEEDPFSGIRTFLANGYVKGIGAKNANEIIKKFGKKSLDLFETEEGREKLTTVKGLGKKSVANAIPSYEENKKYKDIVLFLNGVGTKDQVSRIYAKYEDKALDTLKKNPYCLQLDLNGFGFKKADNIALAAGVKKNSIYRIMAGVKSVIEDAQTNEGHCYLPMEEIKNRLLPLLVPVPKFKDISDKVAENALADWAANKEKLIAAHDPSAATLKELSETAESRELICKGLVDALKQAVEEKYLYIDGENVCTAVMHNTETDVATLLVKMVGQKAVNPISEKMVNDTIKDVEKRKTEENKKAGRNIEFSVTDEQRKAVMLGAKNRVCIISGGPGRGKTAICEIIAKAFLKNGKKSTDNILMLAPTGKAAKRITESTGYNAMTVHRAVLSVRNKDDFPKGKLIIIDESSMVDIFLMHSIMKFAQNCNVIFVGDIDQIASVGPGKVLRDLIDSGKIPFILLKEGHRNSGSIAQNASMINSGITHSHYNYDEHFVYKAFANEYEKTSDGQIIKDTKGEAVVKTSATEFMKKSLVHDYIENVKKYGFENVMLCVAMKERGDVCTTKLNRDIQEALTLGNPTAVYNGRTFRVGDRVMQIKNDYNFVKLSDDKKLTKGVFNGDTGTIVKIEPDPENDSYKMMVKFDDQFYGGYTKNTVANLQLAYAITVHKCQGSEAKCVMMAYTYSDYMLLNRSLFYTGVTRGKEVCYLYGEEQYRYGGMLSAFDIAVRKTVDIKRNTMLGKLLTSA